MIYFRFHIGDWEQKTRLLSPIEKGIYVDLLTYYYSTEHPIVRSNYERITRGYTEEEKKAADYVLSTFFTEKDGCYYNKRCEEEIAAWQEKSSKSKKSIKARWDREKNRISNNQKDSDEHSHDDSIDDTNVCTKEDTDVCTNDDANGILTINHKPITKNINNTNKQQTEISEAVDAPFDEGVCCVSSCKDNFSEDEVIDAPINVQIEHAQLGALEGTGTLDEKKPLSLVELITACKTFGIRLSHTPKTEDIASRKTVNLVVLRECVKAWKGTNTGTGYFIGILENASKDPNSILPHDKREKPELSAETITDKQAGYFASRLVKDASFQSTFGVGHQSFDTFIDQVTQRLHDPEYFNEYKPWMQKLGFMSTKKEAI